MTLVHTFYGIGEPVDVDLHSSVSEGIEMVQ